MGEHPHPWALLHAQEEPSRRRRSNERGRFDPHASRLIIVTAACNSIANNPSFDSPNEKSGVDSRPPRLHYPQGSFSDRPGPQLIRHRGSLGHTFVSGFFIFQNPIRLPFALTLFSGFLTRMRKPLGTLDSVSRVYRPSQTAHLTMSPER